MPDHHIAPFVYRLVHGSHIDSALQEESREDGSIPSRSIAYCSSRGLSFCGWLRKYYDGVVGFKKNLAKIGEKLLFA